MEATAPRTARLLWRRRAAPDVLPALGAWVLGATLVGYLAFANGGYDTVVRGQVGIAVWWIVLLGALVGVLPGRVPAAGWVGVGLITALTAFALLSTTWSESVERTMADVAKFATYAGVLVLGLGAQGRARAKHLAGGIAFAIAAVGVLALLSRLHPSWFPVNDQVRYLHNTRRLAYPLNYWNGVAAFVAMGIPLLLAFAGTARRLAVQALSAGVIPALALTMYFTAARGGIIALAVGLVVFLVLSDDRLARLATLAAAAAGSAIVILAAQGRPLVLDQLTSSAGLHDGRTVLWLTACACAGVALVQVAIGLAARHAQRAAWLEPGRGRAAAIGAGLVLVLVAAGIAGGVPGTVADRWDGFIARPTAANQPTGNDLVARLQSANGNGRYQYWQSSAVARDRDPLQGTGSGTFELWWAQHGTVDGFVRDGHSLYMETMGELGWPGLLLVISLVGLLLVGGAVRSLRARYELRTVLAGATAGIAVFATTAAYEWVFELGAVAAALLLLGAVALAGSDTADAGPTPRPGRIACVVLAVAALTAIALPLAGATQLKASQRAASAGDLSGALADARSAQRVQPYAAGPRIQEALLLEQGRDYGAALSAARVATAKEPDGWRGWLVRSRIEAEAGNGAAAVRSFRRARALNPRSPLFAR